MKFQKIFRSSVLMLLLTAMLMSVHSPVIAQGGKSDVNGSGDLILASTAEVRIDGAGNSHYQGREYTGIVDLAGDGVTLSGTQTLVLKGYEDTTHSGPFTGTYILQAVVNEEPMKWTGRVEGYSFGGFSYARIVAQEEGEPTGSQLKLNLIEFQLPEDSGFEINGQILERP